MKFLEKIPIYKTMYNSEEGGFNNLVFPPLIHLPNSKFSLLRHQKRKRRIPMHLLCYHTLHLNHFQLFFFNEIKHRFVQISLFSKCYCNTASVETISANYLALISSHSFLVIHCKSPAPDVPALPTPTRDNGRDS